MGEVGSRESCPESLVRPHWLIENHYKIWSGNWKVLLKVRSRLFVSLSRPVKGILKKTNRLEILSAVLYWQNNASQTLVRKYGYLTYLSQLIWHIPICSFGYPSSYPSGCCVLLKFLIKKVSIRGGYIVNHPSKWSVNGARKSLMVSKKTSCHLKAWERRRGPGDQRLLIETSANISIGQGHFGDFRQ